MDVFQKLAWKEFVNTFPTEEHCVEEIISRLRDNGWQFHCRQCSSRSFLRNWGKRKYRCSDCGYRGWILAESYFEFIRKARLWLGSIWLFERGLYINAWQFHRLAKCAYSTALMIFRKLSTVVHEYMNEGAEFVDSKEFLSIFWKRSNQTPVGEHPIAEQDAFEEESSENKDGDEVIGGQVGDESIVSSNSSQESDESNPSIFLPSVLSKEEKVIYEFICEKRVHVDDICRSINLKTGTILATLTMLELGDLVERHGGDYYSQKVKKEKRIVKSTRFVAEISPLTQVKIDDFLDLVKSKIHGISRKYLQLYLAAFWCKINRERWGNGQLFYACSQSQFKPSREIFHFISPAQVMIR